MQTPTTLPFLRFALRAGLALLAATAAGSAHAHSGHGNDIIAGLLHPLLGMDHLIAFVATGVWIAQLQGPSVRFLPVGFVAVMAAAAGAAIAGAAVPVAEPGVVGSLLLAGLLIAFRIRLSVAAGATIVAIFAMLHGYVHGAELPDSSLAWAYVAGFLVTTALLLYAGIGLGRLLAGRATLLPAAGAMVFASGGWMLAHLS